MKRSYVCLLIVFVFVLNVISCSKHSPLPDQANPSYQSSIQNPLLTTTGAVSFWLRNYFFPDDSYVYYAPGFVNVSVNGTTKTLCYRINENWAQSCTDLKTVTFTLSHGTYHWSVSNMNGILLKQGTGNIGPGQCIVKEI